MVKQDLKSEISSDLQLARLIALGKLWANVAIFHPYLAYQDIDWDLAFVQAVERLEAADTEYLSVVQTMLAALGDSCSHADFAQTYPPVDALPSRERQLFRLEDSVAVFDL